MTDPATLLALADRCEQAAGPDRELDCYIHAPREGRNIKPERWIETVRVYSHMVPRYTASLDAAVMLVPEGWIYELGRGESGTSRALCRMGDERGIWTGWAVAATAALALCAAALRARAAAYE
jgi:hypothetical protein